MRGNPKIVIYEQTDIRNVSLKSLASSSESQVASNKKKTAVIYSPDIILVDVSFISLRDVLPSITRLMTKDSRLVAMCKPQFESGARMQNKGVVKNEKMRREILRSFEDWSLQYFKLWNKADSKVSGEKGNLERFYLFQDLNLV